jgi:hypothetical protein
MHLKNLVQHVKVVVEAKGNKVHLQHVLDTLFCMGKGLVYGTFQI